MVRSFSDPDFMVSVLALYGEGRKLLLHIALLSLVAGVRHVGEVVPGSDTVSMSRTLERRATHR
jgi:hypothetical protein